MDATALWRSAKKVTDTALLLARAVYSTYQMRPEATLLDSRQVESSNPSVLKYASPSMSISAMVASFFILVPSALAAATTSHLTALKPELERNEPDFAAGITNASQPHFHLEASKQAALVRTSVTAGLWPACDLADAGSVSRRAAARG